MLMPEWMRPMSYARVVTSSSGQRVEMPDDMRLAADRVDVRRRGDAVILTPVQPARERIDVEAVRRILQQIPDDAFDAIEDARRQDRGRAP